MLLVDAPPDFELTLETPPLVFTGFLGTPQIPSGNASPHPRAEAPAPPLDVIVGFFSERAALEEGFPELACALQPAGGLWIAWPKKSAGVTTDLNENGVREVGLAGGLVDNKVCAITEVWSGLRFVYRLRDRPPAIGA